MYAFSSVIFNGGKAYIEEVGNKSAETLAKKQRRTPRFSYLSLKHRRRLSISPMKREFKLFEGAFSSRKPNQTIFPVQKL